MADKPHLIQDDTQSTDDTDTGLYGSNVTGPISENPTGDEEDFEGHMPNPDKVESKSTLDMAQEVGLYTEYSDEGDGSQGEINAAQEHDELENNEENK